MKVKIEYEDYKNMIFQLAHRFHKTTNIEFDELVACGNLEFVKCQENYDPLMASFSTYLTIRVKGLFIEMGRKNYRTMAYNVPIADYKVDYKEEAANGSAEQQLIFKETLQRLSQTL